MAEQERYNKVDICCARCDVAAEHEDSRCASSHHLPRSPALSVSDVPASQASSRVDVRPRSSCSAAARRAVARRAPQRSLCDLCRRPHVAGHAERPATDELPAIAVRWACMSSKMSRAARLQCTTACCLRIVCGDLWLMERAKCGRDVQWGNAPLHPSCIYIIYTIYNRLDA